MNDRSVTSADIAELVAVWYLSESCALSTHAWLCGLAMALDWKNPAKRYAGKLRDAVLRMPRGDFLALAKDQGND